MNLLSKVVVVGLMHAAAVSPKPPVIFIPRTWSPHARVFPRHFHFQLKRVR